MSMLWSAVKVVETVKEVRTIYKAGRVFDSPRAR
jgi:hypothetical protein